MTPRHVLVRSGKDPATVVSPEASLARNGWGVFGANSGNLLFQLSLHRALSVPGADVVSDSLLPELGGAGDEYIERVNGEFDLYVIPLANAFRGSYVTSLTRLTAFIERLRIPVVVVGIGAQLQPGAGVDDVPDRVDDAGRAFVRAVLERSDTIGVRGEITRDYLQHLGFPASSVDIIGCPSLYLHGPELAVTKGLDRLDTDSRIALNITPSKAAFARLVDAATRRFPNLTYLPQEHHDLAMMLWGEEQIAVRHTDPRIPTHLGHPLYTGNRMRFFVDAVPWVDYLRDYDYAFGTRLHGNIAALLAGIPATVIAHDSRTAELARYHGIPHRGLAAIDETTTAEELYDEADLTDFHRLYPEGFAAYRAFLDRNRVPHVFDEATRTGAEDFDARLAAVPFPPAVQVAAADPAKTDIYARLRWLRQGGAVDKYRSVDGYQPAFAPGVAETGLDRAVPDIQRLSKKVEALTRQVAALQKQATRQSHATRPLWRRAGSRVKRIVGK